MGKEIIQQPDGKYALYSHSTDILCGLDMDRKEVCDYFARSVPSHLRDADIADTNQILDRIDAGGTHYDDGALSLEEALKQHTPNNCMSEEINKEVAKRKKALKKPTKKKVAKKKRKSNAKDGG